MAFALVAHVKATPGSGGGTTGAIDTTGADIIVVAVSWYAGGAEAAVTDSKGNTWTGLTKKTEAGNVDAVRLFYCIAPTVGSGHTFTNLSAYPTICVAAFSGALAGGYEAESGATGVAVTALAPGNLTPSEAGELIVTALGRPNAGTNTPSVDGGFTISDNANWTAGVNEAGALAYLFQVGAAAVNPSWSWSGSSNAAAVMAVFKGAAAAARAKVGAGLASGSMLRGGLVR